MGYTLKKQTVFCLNPKAEEKGNKKLPYYLKQQQQQQQKTRTTINVLLRRDHISHLCLAFTKRKVKVHYNGRFCEECSHF